MNIISDFEQEPLRSDIPAFRRPGDTAAGVRDVAEGNRERSSRFWKASSSSSINGGVRETFTVRRISWRAA